VEQYKRKRARKILYSLAIALASAAVAPAALGQALATERFFPLTLPVFDIETPVGTVSARVSPDGNFRVPVASLLPILEHIYAPAEFEALKARVAGIEEVGPEESARLSLAIRFDAQKVALILDVPAAIRGTAEIEVGRTSRAPEPSAARRAPEPFSAYLNMNVGIVDDPTLRSGRTRGTMLLEGAVRVSDYVLENAATLQVGGPNHRFFSRQGTRLTRDFPDAGIRVSAGDLFTNSRGFIGSEDFVGVSVLKNVDVFNPFQTSRPTGRQSFTLSRPSDVDIYVNGALIRQMRLQPGNYDLTNFPLVEGGNDVRVEVRDDLGQVQNFTFTSYYDADLLAVGKSEWDLSAGFESTRFDTRLDYDFDEMVVAASYRRGITDSLTLGASARYLRDQVMLGAEAVAATPIANISFDLAGSHRNGRSGAALALTVQPQLSDAWIASGRSIDGFVEFATRDFGDYARGGSGQRARVGIRYNDLFLNERLAFSAAGSYTSLYGRRGRDGFELSASFGYRFDYDFVLRVTPNYRELAGNQNEASIRVSLSKSFGRRSRSRASYESRDNRYLAEYDYRSQFGGIGTLGANVTASRSDNEESIVDSALDFTANRFEASAGYTHIMDQGRGGNLGRVRANIGTAIAFAGGDMAIGRPVRDSFAIFKPHPTLEGRKVVVGPGVAYQGDRARSGPLGAALLSDLGAYALARISYDVRDLPPGYDFGAGYYEFFPSYRSGYSVPVGSNRMASALGFITDSADKPLSFAVGTVTSTTDTEFEPQQIFTNRAGRFGIIGLVPGARYTVTFPDAGVEATISIPEDATGFVNVGRIAGKGE
jgi:outer membrane usher protein